MRTARFYHLLRRMLFVLDAERTHNWAARMLEWMGATPLGAGVVRSRLSVADPRLSQQLIGMRFPNPVGLAAGFDKNGRLVRGIGCLGFGFMEVGTVTPQPQRGNPRPRIFRWPRQRSLQNALGFNNQGMLALQKRLRRSYPGPVPLAVNLGKNRDTLSEDFIEDYRVLVEALSNVCDFFVVNISSPNTPGLRNLQKPKLVREVVIACRSLSERPVLVKLSPDLEESVAVNLAEEATAAGAAGIVVTNTSTDYSLIPECQAVGGLSGEVLREKSRSMLRALAPTLFGRCTLISVGGVSSGDEAYLRLRRGASLVELYTGLIFEGPALIRRINLRLLELLERDGVQQLTDVIGADVKR